MYYASKIASIDLIKRFEHFDWNAAAISSRKDVIHVMKYVKNINMKTVSINPSVTMSFVKQRHDLNWNTTILFMNPSIGLYLHDVYDISLNSYAISNNTALTVNYILRHPNIPWKWSYVSRCVSPDIEVCSKKWMAAWKIQQRLYNVVAFDPKYKYCQKLLVSRCELNKK